MDINLVRGIVTVVGLVLFIALVVHTWRRARKAEHDAAAMLPFAGESDDPAAPAGTGAAAPEGERK